MYDQSELVLDFSRNGKAANTTVTARSEDTVLHVDKIDIGKSKARKEFAASVCKNHPRFKHADVETVLREQAAKFASSESKEKVEPAQPKSEELLQRMPESVRDDARAMLESPDLMKRVIDDVASLAKRSWSRRFIW